MCYADRNWTECESCLRAAAVGMASLCPRSRAADTVYDACLLRYSDASSSFAAANTTVVSAYSVRLRGGLHSRWRRHQRLELRRRRRAAAAAAGPAPGRGCRF
uniref:Gnk2-homologous domain-containing protein n=1 Tax=Oryza meridionalis TaxID=40149 RepID=A0A0E0DGW6_9ORYZ